MIKRTPVAWRKLKHLGEDVTFCGSPPRCWPEREGGKDGAMRGDVSKGEVEKGWGGLKSQKKLAVKDTRVTKNTPTRGRGRDFLDLRALGPIKEKIKKKKAKKTRGGRAVSERQGRWAPHRGEHRTSGGVAKPKGGEKKPAGREGLLVMKSLEVRGGGRCSFGAALEKEGKKKIPEINNKRGLVQPSKKKKNGDALGGGGGRKKELELQGETQKEPFPAENIFKGVIPSLEKFPTPSTPKLDARGQKYLGNGLLGVQQVGERAVLQPRARAENSQDGNGRST